MRINKPYTSKEYADLAVYCNRNNCHIEDRGGYLEAVANPVPEITVKDYEAAVDAHIDAVAQANDFDSILHCTKYDGFDNEFRERAESLLEWNAACWVKCHEVMNAVSAGTRTAPTIEELVAELPPYSEEGAPDSPSAQSSDL